MPAPPRIQHEGDLELHLDGDAYAWAWSPNIGNDSQHLEMDLLADLAKYASLGIGQPVEAPRRGSGDLAVIVEVHLGARGHATLAGDTISEAAVAALVAAGWALAVQAGASAGKAPPS